MERKYIYYDRKFESIKTHIFNGRPIKYKGYLICHRREEYNRLILSVFDIVREKICIAQYAGLNGAKRFIDNIN